MDEKQQQDAINEVTSTLNSCIEFANRIVSAIRELVASNKHTASVVTNLNQIISDVNVQKSEAQTLLNKLKSFNLSPDTIMDLLTYNNEAASIWQALKQFNNSAKKLIGEK